MYEINVFFFCQHIVLQLILNSMQDTNDEIIKIVCDTLLIMMNEFWHHLQPASKQIFEFYLKSMQSANENICITASEFWSLYATDNAPDRANDILIEFLPALIPVLVQGCRYTMDLLSSIDFESDQQSHVDIAEDIAPLFYTSHSNKSSLDKQLDEGLILDEEQCAWNVRKCCAVQLDNLSRIPELKQPLLNVLLPIIQQLIGSEQFVDREAALLALGAVTETSDDIPQLSKIMPFLIEQTSHQHLLVRQIAQWTLMRLTDYFNTDDGSVYFDKVFKCFLDGIKDNSKRVQRASCGSLAGFVRNTNFKIVAEKYVEPLMEVFVWGFNNYQMGNYTQLLDVIIQTVDTIAKAPDGNGMRFVCSPQMQDTLLPPVLSRWQTLESLSSVVINTDVNDDNVQLDDDDDDQASVELKQRQKQKEYDTNIFPLFEAISRWSVFMGSDQHFQKQYMKPLFEHALNLAMDLKNACLEYVCISFLMFNMFNILFESPKW